MLTLRIPALLGTAGAVLSVLVVGGPDRTQPGGFQEECEVTLSPDTIFIGTSPSIVEYTVSATFPTILTVTSANNSGLAFPEVDTQERELHINTARAREGEWPVHFHGPEVVEGESNICSGAIVVALAPTVQERPSGAPALPSEPPPAPAPAPEPEPAPTPMPAPEPSPQPDPEPMPDPVPEPELPPVPDPEPNP